MSASFYADPKLQEKIRDQIARGDTSEALLLLFENGYDQAIGLKNRVDQAQAHFEAKRIEYETWSRLLNQVNFEILAVLNPEMLADTDSPTTNSASKGKPFQFGPVPKAAVFALLDQNKIPEALDLCENLGNDQIILKARYHAGRKYVLMGLVSSETWAMLEKQIRYALEALIKKAPELELSRKLETASLTEGNKPQNAPKTMLERFLAFLRD